MRRLFALAAAIALAVSLSVPVSADTTGGCLAPGQCRTSGRNVDAWWSGIPDGGPVPGVVYTDTSVSAGIGTFSGGGLRSTSAWMWLDRFSYEFDANGNQIPVAETFGFGNAPDVNVVIAKTLSSGSASGTIQAVSCTFDPNWNETCGDPAATSVSGTWTATGARMQSVYTSHSKGGGSSYTSTFQGAQRLASASVSIGGVGASGALAWADINDSQGNTVSICHGPTCP